MRYRIRPSVLKGKIVIPPSKSHTLRAILFASLAKGKSQIRNFLPSPDTTAMIHACQQLGAHIEMSEQVLTISGTASKPSIPEDVIDAGNSGQVLRFISAIAALTSGYTVVTGDHSIRTNRPIKPLLDALTKLNVFAISTKNDGYAPVIIKGPLHGGKTILNGEDSQPVSGLLIASAFADQSTEIEVTDPGETPWINLTLDWFQRLQINYKKKNYHYYFLQGQASYPGFEYSVPGDFSSAAFPLIAALITHSEIDLYNLDMKDVQGDKALIYVLQKMGAELEMDEHKKIIRVKKTKSLLKAQAINVNDFIDAVTILAVMGCFAEGETTISGAAIARKKESDRLTVITHELQKMNAKIKEQENGLMIKTSHLTGASVNSHSDHRIAMSLAVAGLAASGETIVENTHCVAKSFPNFVTLMQELGAHIEIDI